MKAKEVLQLLRISRATLSTYCKKGIVKYRVLPNGRYDYDKKSVFAFLNRNINLKTVVYARVSAPEQKKELVSQTELLKSFCFQNGWQINAVYQDIAGGLSFEKRTAFFQMLDEIVDHKIERVVISYKDRLSRVGFELFSHLFRKFGTEIIVMSEAGSEKLDSQEIFDEIVSLLHSYNMKLYSDRRENIIREICKPEESVENYKDYT